MLQNIKKKTEGFTIIEVLIVLAIAGLIMLIVFLAVPALQRNSRNTSRRSEAGRYAAAANEFVSNNSGKLPSGAAGAGGAAATDPTTIKTAVGAVQYYTATPSIKDGSAAAVAAYTSTDSVQIVTGAQCDGASTAPGTARQMAVQYGLEPSTAACQNV